MHFEIMSSHPSRSVLVTQNPGGFQAVIPLFFALQEDPEWEVATWFGDDVAGIVHHSSIQLVAPDTKTRSRIRDYIRRDRPEVVLVGTSAGMSLDKEAIRAARTHSIPSIALVDFWGGVHDRFSSPGTTDFAFIPDRIAAIDEANVAELVASGIERERIVLTGNPHFSVVAQQRKEHQHANGKCGRDILFLDQPFSDADGPHYGYTEVTALQDVLVALDAIALDGRIVVALHPRSSGGTKYAECLRTTSRRHTIVESNGSILNSVQCARLVIGMNSAVLFHAALLGRHVISYQPELRGPDPLRSNTLGATTPVYRRDDLLPAMQQALEVIDLSQERQSVLAAYADSSSVERVFALMQQARH
jgi:hypothetical protein